MHSSPAIHPMVIRALRGQPPAPLPDARKIRYQLQVAATQQSAMESESEERIVMHSSPAIHPMVMRALRGQPPAPLPDARTILYQLKVAVTQQCAIEDYKNQVREIICERLFGAATRR